MKTIDKNISTFGLLTELTPNSKLKIEHYSKTGFINFEKYDYRFRWDKPNSEIDIYLPINTNN